MVHNSSHEPLVSAFGDDETLRAMALSDLGNGDHPARMVIGAVRWPLQKVVEARDEYRATLESLYAGVRVSRATTVAVIIDASRNPPRWPRWRLFRTARTLAEDVAVWSGFAGRDLHSFSVVVTRASHRRTVGERLREFATAPIRSGDGVVLRSGQLRRQALRELIAQEIL